MSNIYQCENCGHEYEIPAEHIDNSKITVMGILYIDNCYLCEV